MLRLTSIESDTISSHLGFVTIESSWPSRISMFKAGSPCTDGRVFKLVLPLHLAKVTQASWQSLDIPPPHLAKLLDGLKPRTVEDKGFIYADELDSQGRTNVHFCHSWASIESFILKINTEDKPAKLTGIAHGRGRCPAAGDGSV
ncbi:hypothetical protein CDD80_3059 [Ophiocordyceps camponoti-rufipedis]|uniref:Uncharacterized protein n=1 Tax=Ophiocordyceps camponoti-rufipedis TaxID=2004952 RepID=A0A2C5XJB3_9HYPO|nr:hypothetical protein CDD80_3059 [Ophiocordyceps camponoti-rufipedis]